jgi:hypothetical protein
MPLSSAQKGAIGQFAFLAAALATGKGQVEAYTPAADNEGRDAEIRRHMKRTPSIGIQIKVAFATQRIGLQHKQKYLEIRFNLPEDRVQNDPRLWYFLALYELSQVRLFDPVYLVPSHIFHRAARRGKWRGKIQFAMFANLGAEAHDSWSRYRVPLKDIGPRLLEIIDGAQLTAKAGALPLPAGAIVLGRVRRPMASSRRERAA